jgi:hypothetical protein
VDQTKPFRPRSGVIMAIGLVLIAVYITGLIVVMGVTTYDTWAAMFIGPLLVAVSLPILARQARRENDRRLLVLLVVALLFKLGGGVARQYVAFDVYQGVADANYYDHGGRELAAKFRIGDFDTGLGSFSSTDFIVFTTGIVYTIIGPTTLGAFLVYSWFGFWGLFLFYRAFTMAVPEGRRRTYARLLFFLPSLLFWPSSIGKEAWMMFTLGIAAFGAAHIMARRAWRGLPIAVLGLWLAAFVRPHVSGLMALGIAGGFLLRRPRDELRELAPIVKALAVTAVAVVALVFVTRATAFLKTQGVDTGQGVSTALQSVTSRTLAGGSSFVPSILESPTRAPVAIVTVLFRPLVTEAHNAQALAAALEGTFLLVLSLIRIRWIIAALRSVRRQPYVAFAAAYAGVFILAFSSFANFGLLARERVQLFPLYLVLLTIPHPKRKTTVAAPMEEHPLARQQVGWLEG